MTKALYQQTINLAQGMVDEYDPRLNAQTYAARENVKLAMPDVFLQVFELAVDELLAFHDLEDLDWKSVYRSIEIIPNQEMSVVLFHKEYPKCIETWMIHKVCRKYQRLSSHSLLIFQKYRKQNRLS